MVCQSIRQIDGLKGPMLPCASCETLRGVPRERCDRMRRRAHRYRARRRRRDAVARRAGARLVPYYRGLSRRHRYQPVPRLGLPVGLGARWDWRTGAPGHQRAVGARASERRVDRLVAAARRHRRALPDCGNRRGARLQSLRVHRPHRAAVPPAAGTHRVDRHDQLHAGGDARPAARGGDSSDRAGHARRDGTPAAAVGLERAAGPRHAGTRAPRGRPRLRHRQRAAPTCARGGTLRGLAASGGAVCGRPDGMCHARGDRGRRHGHGALAARRECGGQDLPDCRRPGRRHRSHRHHRQPYPGACRPSRDLQLVFSDRDGGGRVGPLERSSTTPAFASHGCVGKRGRRGTAAAGHAAARWRRELGAAHLRAEVGDAAGATAGATPLPDHGAGAEPHRAPVRWRIRHQLDPVRRGRRGSRDRPAGHADELRAAGGGRGDDHARAGAACVGVPRALRRSRPAARGAAPSGHRSGAPAPRPDRGARPRSPTARRQGADGIVGAGGDAGRGAQGEDAARARRRGRVPHAHRLDADRAVPPHPFRRAARRRRPRVHPRQCVAGRREPVHQLGHERVLLPAAEHPAGSRAGPRARDGVPRARPRDRPGRLRAGTAHLDARGAHRRAVHHAARAGGGARQRGRAVAVCAGGGQRHRSVSARSGEGPMKVRKAECGMRNCTGGSIRGLDLPFTFRTPHSAFRILFLLLLAGRAEAQVDPSGTWRTLHTPHFRIHFRPAYRDAALLEAREAERSYGLLATELHPPRGVVDITLADDIDAANGLTSVAPTNRITIFAAPPAGDHGLLFFDNWLRLVTTHELAHVFHLDRSRGLWAGLQRVFGRAPGLFPNEYQPSWVTEGLATYYESKFTNAGRVRGTAPDLAGASAAPPAARVLDSLLRTEPVPRVSPDGRRVAYVRDDRKGTSMLRVLDAATGRPLAAHRVNGGVDYDWLGDTLVVTQLDFTSPWRIRSDLYRWVPGRAWRRMTHGARLVAPGAGGGQLAAIVLGPASGRPTVPAPALPRRAVWEDVTPSPDGRWVAGSRSVDGHWALVRWPVDSPDAAVVLLETGGSIADVVWTSGGELWFVADPTGVPQAYRWRDSGGGGGGGGGGAQPLTNEPLRARAPAPLADGTLLYAAPRARGWQLRRASALEGAA